MTMLVDRTMAERVALVTGAGKGIGRACVEALVGSGMTVIAVTRTASDLEQLAGAHGERVVPWCHDVTDPAFLARLGELERLDALVNNAGANAPMPFTDVDEGTLDRLMNLNVRSVFLTAQAAVRAMRRGADADGKSRGAIINITSQMGHVGSANRTVYCMTKHAVEGLTKAMAVELAPEGIRVNSVAPTFIETPMTRPMFENPEFAAFVQRSIPLGHVGKPEDVAAAVLFLASAGAGMVTGHSLLVDGGWTAQ